MLKPNLTIKIIGLTGSGKTSLALLVSHVLVGFGFIVEIVEHEGGKDKLDMSEDRLRGIATMGVVRLETVQEIRDAIPEETDTLDNEAVKEMIFHCRSRGVCNGPEKCKCPCASCNGVPPGSYSRRKTVRPPNPGDKNG